MKPRGSKIYRRSRASLIFEVDGVEREIRLISETEKGTLHSRS